jgi:hypothetical protein
MVFTEVIGWVSIVLMRGMLRAKVTAVRNRASFGTDRRM